MIVDTSAIIAILTSEVRRLDCLSSIQQASSVRLSAATLVETSIVLVNKQVGISDMDLDFLLTTLKIGIEPVTESQTRLARLAYQQFGRGGHNKSKAKLNFGDCFAYALAREKNEPLLFVGNDFSHTDITPALT